MDGVRLFGVLFFFFSIQLLLAYRPSYEAQFSSESECYPSFGSLHRGESDQVFGMCFTPAKGSPQHILTHAVGCLD